MLKTKGIWRGLNGFFSLLGILTVVGLVFVFVSNAAGLGTFISVLGLIKTQSLYELDNSKLFQGAASGVVELLKDPYSEYLDPSTWQDLKVRLDAKFGGIGVYVLQDDSGRLKIFSPIKGTPAFEAGVKHGDIITKINGESATGMTQDEAIHLMRGDPGTQLLLTVFRQSEQKEYDFKIIREIINVPSVDGRMLDDASQIAYIQLNQFHANSAQEMESTVNNLVRDKKAKGIILDLRDNGGGDFDAAIKIADLFLDDVEVVSAKDTHGNKKVYRAASGKIAAPMVVLVNGDSASASEILAAALQDNRRAVLVGQKTFGKGLVQTVFPLRDGGALKLTTQKYFTPRGTDINEIGINPDYVVKNNPGKNEDLQLQKAEELLKKQIY
ncbi:S41 family peptidase [Syntrophomonas palmitatica]|uniref:S41 family peptidase n=1 Tax=Syntrophomonas palmitatica TaxID=402877 RepID=UPI000B19476D|nr:S41 family peptidase [Syntrophomonas palmitatica]